MSHRSLPFVAVTLLMLASRATAEHVVTYRERTAEGERPLRAAKGKIESESLLGVRIHGKLIASSDIIDVSYDLPGIRLELSRAANAENQKSYDDAIKEYRGLQNQGVVANNPAAKRHF